MIDWYLGLIGYNAQDLKLGMVQEISPQGEITYQTERWASAMGSFERDIRVSRESSPELMRYFAEKYNFVCNPIVYKIRGSPSKFLQGHNVFGPSVRSLGPVVQAIIRGLPGEMRPRDADDTRWPGVIRRRVDVTISVRMDSDAMVHEFIHHAQLETRSRHKRQQSGLTGSTTVSWGVGTSRWMLSAYCKFCELPKHPVANPDMQSALLEYSEGLLRMELRLFTKELRPRGTLDESIVWEFWNRIEVGVMKDDVEKGVASLRPKVRQIYLLWLDGHDVSPAAGFFKRATFYQYRKEILEATGQDISKPPVKLKGSKLSREVFGTDWLKAHQEPETPPSHLRKYLYVPGDSPIWGSH